MLRCSTTTYSIKITNIDIYFLYQIRHVQQRYEGLSVVNIPLILFTIHVIGVFLFKKNKLLNNVLSKLDNYFIDKELQHSDDSIVCLAHVISCLSRKS